MSLLPLPEAATTLAGPLVKPVAEGARKPSEQSFVDVLTKTPSLDGDQHLHASPPDLEQQMTEGDDAQPIIDETLTESDSDEIEAEAVELAPEAELGNEPARPRRPMADPSEALFSSHLRQTTPQWTPAALRDPVDGVLPGQPVAREPAHQIPQLPIGRVPPDTRPSQTPPAPVAFGMGPTEPLVRAEAVPVRPQPVSVPTNDGQQAAQANSPLRPDVTKLGANEPAKTAVATIDPKVVASPVAEPKEGQPIKTTLVQSTPVSETRPHVPFERTGPAPQTTAPIGRGPVGPGSPPSTAAPSVMTEPVAKQGTASVGIDGPEPERVETPPSVTANVPNATQPGQSALGQMAQAVVKPNAVAQMTGLPPKDLVTNADRMGSDERADFMSSLSIEDAIALSGADTTRSIAPIGPDVARVEMAKSVGAQLAEQMIKRSQGVVDVTLNPEELGRVKMAVNAGESTVSISIMAERPETLDLMRRHIDQLIEEFQQMGFEGVELAFSDGAAAQDDTSDTPSSNDAWGSSEPTEMALETPDENPNRPGQQSGLDMRL